MYFLVIGLKGIWVFSRVFEALDFANEFDKQGETYTVVQNNELDKIVAENYN